MKIGKSFKFENVYLEETSTVCGPIEALGPLSNSFDVKYEDLRINAKSFEKSEMIMLDKAINVLLEKINIPDNKIDIALGGDLINQEIIAHYTLRDYNIPFVGLYGACSTSILSILMGSILIDSKNIDNALCFTSSHNLTSERQFRNPTEYGGAKKETQTYTATGAVCAYITNKKSKIKITSGTIGRIIDVGFKDVLDMGRAMAPAACETILDYLNDFNKKPSDFDMIFTGDLSYYGSEIVHDVLEEKYGIIKNYNDCGNLLYNKELTPIVMAGGSGCACCGLVTYGHIKQMLLNNEYKRVLICGTGALMNSDIMLQRESIPAICHAICLEVEE